MLLEWLEHVIQGGETVLDVGTGSGLLAMVALRLGANTAVGIDHDADAIDCAREYAFVNGFGPELSLQCGIVAGDRPYDLVLANLDRQTLLQLAAPLEASTGRMLLVSGLLRDQCAEIEEAFARVDLFPCSIREQDGYKAGHRTPTSIRLMFRMEEFPSIRSLRPRSTRRDWTGIVNAT
jgi:ribosomal protein L11 methyltransferase